MNYRWHCLNESGAGEACAAVSGSAQSPRLNPFAAHRYFVGRLPLDGASQMFEPSIRNYPG